MKETLKHQQPGYGSTDFDVIISGAGPVGLFLACELALAKCTVLVLEKESTPGSVLKKFPFGTRGLNAPSIEALYRRNLLDELEVPKRMKQPHQNHKNTQDIQPKHQVGHFAGIPFYSEDIDHAHWTNRLPTATAPQLLSEMAELESVLSRRATELGAVIKYGTPVMNFHQTRDDVIVYSDSQAFKARWLVGCDGSKSIVRKLGGFEFVGTEPEFTGYSATVEIRDPEKLAPGRNVTSTGMYLLSQKDYIIIQDFDGGKFHGAGQAVTLEHLQEVLRRISGTDVTLTKLMVATTWTDRARQASRYRNGRVILAGDAAHIHSPLGGQGLNLGLGDAMNLGWKLAATIHHTTTEHLLDSYESERHPIGEKVLDWSRAQVAIMKPEPSSKALNSIFRDLLNTRDGATYFAGRVWGVSTGYDLGVEHPLVGQSVPNFEFEDGTTIGHYMHDGKGLLLDFLQDSSLENLAAGYKNQLNYLHGKVKVQLGISAALVRPDGVVVWVDKGAFDISELGREMGRWYVKDIKRINSI
ncbi:FAD-dependent oxidoreductase [Chitinophaga caeni]|uniref:FAD-dependent oxidoreductase n=1 Tax=Chitinophaga caeni TaxID=2029983 RepID=A0A291QPZ0_9BACT|nr:FAD-dependent monooxygenase [Chitinophaga caeni]ATL46068.1 FAD-dependent oxidoreductase [Chitinophaga caeni]